MKDLDFYYNFNLNKVLDNINLEILEGKIIVIVGESGSGKIILLKLLFRFYKLINGEIEVGGVLLDNIDLYCWCNSCGVVL